MAISSFNGGQQSTRIVASDAGQDIKIGADSGTEALNVAGTFLFQDDFIGVVPNDEYQAFLNSFLCIQKSILKQLKIMNQHLSSISDLEDLDIEPGEDSYGAL
jgi:hypothetical protein